MEEANPVPFRSVVDEPFIVREPDKRRRLSQVTLFVLWAVATGIAAAMSPSPHGHGTHQKLGLPPCPSALLLDRPCPGCGLTTSWTRMVHGDLVGAFQAHAFGPITYALFTVCAIGAMIAFVRGFRLNSYNARFSKAVGVFAAVFIGYGIVRMAVVTDYRSPRERMIMGIEESVHELPNASGANP